ncbi:MAG: hypothetical protein GY869_00660, partial [Planctomycetes bacterium]|nr:hypothetical protein [Planctomycetota bacterium]
ALATFPGVASSAAGVVTVTAANSGTVGNFYPMGFTGEVPGITVVTTGFAGGATDPVLTGIFDVLGEQRYTTIGFPEWWQDDNNIVITFLEERFNPGNAILDGFAFQGRSGTYATVLAEANALNSQVFVFGQNNILNTNSHRGAAILQPGDWQMAYFMGVYDKILTTGTPIADDVIATNGRLDAIGGPALASKPYHNIDFKRCPVAKAGDIYSTTEQKE